MRLEAKKHLWDMQRACGRIAEFTAGRTFEQYAQDAMLRSAVERQFEIIGEALNRLRRDEPEVAAGITGAPRIIAFRNRLIHGYDAVSNEAVWLIVERYLPVLAREVEALLAQPDDP